MGEITAKFLNEKLGVEAHHALYDKAGKLYEHLVRFPGALFDNEGYVLFETQEAYEACSFFAHVTKAGSPTEKVNVTGPGISQIPGYIKLDKMAQQLWDEQIDSMFDGLDF